MQTLYQSDPKRGGNVTVVVDMDGALLIDPNPFPYFALVAFDVGGILRLFLLVLVSPLAWFVRRFISEGASIRVLIFVTFVGVKVSDIESAAKAVLPKYYSEDLHPETFRVFSSCGRKCVVTMNPRIMVEPFLKDYLDVDFVSGVEISSRMGIATGFVDSLNVFDSSLVVADIAIGHSKTEVKFMKMGKERCIVPRESKPVKQEDLPKPVIFHDGRLVHKPTPLVTLLILLWFPIGLILSVLRVFTASLGPVPSFYRNMQLLGCRIKVKGTVTGITQDPQGPGTIFVCSHRTVMDPLFVAPALGRMRITCVSYSVSSFTEFLSPMKSFRLTRDRAKDAKLIEGILKEGWNLVLLPEGTTCREPYLLRFSPLFAELTDHIVPVAVSTKIGMFYGSTARGYKWLDPIFFFMNPFPVYEITFLDKLPPDQTCSAGKSRFEVANNVQEMISKVLEFKCTNLTRKDKYQMLAGTDGLIRAKPGSLTRD